MSKFKLNDLVRLKKYPYNENVFMIVGDNNNPWRKPTPYQPNGKEIKIEEDKDFILIKKDGNNFGTKKIDKNGIHVHENEIEHI